MTARDRAAMELARETVTRERDDTMYSLRFRLARRHCGSWDCEDNRRTGVRRLIAEYRAWRLVADALEEYATQNTGPTLLPRETLYTMVRVWELRCERLERELAAKREEGAP